MEARNYLLFFFCFAFHLSNAQSNIDSSLIGIWKGTSICQIKNSACHDEIVIYHISKVQGSDTFNILANKIVNGVEVEMGTLPCIFNKKTKQLISTAYNTIWTFKLTQEKLEGTLIYRNDLFRVVNVTKQN